MSREGTDAADVRERELGDKLVEQQRELWGCKDNQALFKKEWQREPRGSQIKPKIW